MMSIYKSKSQFYLVLTIENSELSAQKTQKSITNNIEIN